jgi:hypothetical protein
MRDLIIARQRTHASRESSQLPAALMAIRHCPLLARVKERDVPAEPLVTVVDDTRVEGKGIDVEADSRFG